MKRFLLVAALILVLPLILGLSRVPDMIMANSLSLELKQVNPRPGYQFPTGLYHLNLESIETLANPQYDEIKLTFSSADDGDGVTKFYIKFYATEEFSIVNGWDEEKGAILVAKIPKTPITFTQDDLEWSTWDFYQQKGKQFTDSYQSDWLRFQKFKVLIKSLDVSDNKLSIAGTFELVYYENDQETYTARGFFNTTNANYEMITYEPTKR
ncbi:MAG: hypothetical protein HQ596_03040 [Candidatus Saganbacteria bacterium]|nr:hypothetical protein [Candidatus Saganbacteria bacterium]